MKYFIPMNKDGNIEISEKNLKEMLANAYQKGYIKGQIDQILQSSPDFAIAEKKESKKESIFSEHGKTFIFRATTHKR